MSSYHKKQLYSLRGIVLPMAVNPDLSQSLECPE